MATYIIPPIQLPHLLFMRAPAKDIIELRAPDSSSRPFTDREIRHALDTDSRSSPFIAVYSSLSAIEGLAPGQGARIYVLDTTKLNEHHIDVIQDHKVEGENEKYFVLSMIPTDCVVRDLYFLKPANYVSPYAAPVPTNTSAVETAQLALDVLNESTKKPKKRRAAKKIGRAKKVGGVKKRAEARAKKALK